MLISIVPLYAALLAALFIFLSMRVIRMRVRLRVAVGDGTNPQLQRAMRVHANFGEYVPLTLILVTFVEIQKYSPLLVHALCWILVIGRVVHAYGVSQQKEDHRLRVAGMVLIFATIIVSALLLFGSFFLGS